MDSYQPIYDAVRSRISCGNVSEAVENVLRDANIGYYFERACSNMSDHVSEFSRPSVLFRPKLKLDGNMYCALYGENIMSGCAGFGESPAKTMLDFDKNWHEKYELKERSKNEKV